LPELIKEIIALPVLRVRISSLEPQFITRELLEALQGSAKVMPHLHISLQSGCDTVLQRMQRRYTCADYLRILDLVRAALPGVEITTDVIVGFPGETEREFLETIQFVERCGFSDIHIFAYSVRPGTKAADMSDHCPPKTIQERVSRLEVLRQKLKQKALQKYIGQPVEVLLDTNKKTGAFGYTPHYHQVKVPQGILGEVVTFVAQRIEDEILQ
jgi:threonylcarbamoyladenosine tRNA methylthiotransferase MtaB